MPKLCTRCKIAPRYLDQVGLCMPCNNTLKKIHSDKMRKAIGEYKILHGCIDCNYNKHHAALEFDHVRGIKKCSVSSLTRNSWLNILTEIEKCEVVCANCHRIRTWNRWQIRKGGLDA